jgi:GDPmannose 4,6-dehydratase
MFGASKPPQNEETPFYPRSPYGAAKVYSYWMAKNYREAYGLYACNGILFNHESPRRGETFVTRKITRAVANILAGKQKKIYLGNLNAQRDWGFAPEYVEAMWLMLKEKNPDDYVLGTGESHSVREFAEETLSYAGITLEWVGKGAQEKGIVKDIDRKGCDNLRKGDTLIEIDTRYYRPTEVDYLRADAAKAQKRLNWKPRTTFTDLVKIMTDYDMKQVGLEPPGEGIEISKKKGFSYTNHDFAFYSRIRERC